MIWELVCTFLKRSHFPHRLLLLLDNQMMKVVRTGVLIKLACLVIVIPGKKPDLAAFLTCLGVRFRSDSCNALYAGLPLKTVWKVQLRQNSVPRGLTGGCRSWPVALLLKLLLALFLGLLHLAVFDPLKPFLAWD